jgi:Putative zinc-finger
MSHLGTRVTALVDGELSPDAAARAHAHAAECAECRAAVEAERGTRWALQSTAGPAVPQGLTAALLTMGGPSGPLPPRPGHLPGTPRPEALSLPRRPAGRSGVAGPGRTTTGGAARTARDRRPRQNRRRTAPEPVPGRSGRGRRIRGRLAVAVIGSVSIASVSVLSMLVLGGLLDDAGPALPASSQLTIERNASARQPLFRTPPSPTSTLSPWAPTPSAASVAEAPLDPGAATGPARPSTTP